MATDPLPRPPLDISEQVARIDQIQADIAQKLAATIKIKQETRFAPWTIVTTALGAGAALFAAGIAFAKLFVS